MKKIILSVGVCVLVLIIAIGVLQLSSNNADDRMANEVALNNAGNTTLEINETANETSKTITVQASEKTPARAQNGALVIGSDDAPVTILEFSSLTCPHCASFHNGPLPALKKDYINRGKVKIVFHDFPLNKPAMAASLLLKCVDIDKRYDFMDMLFEQQSAWAFDPLYGTKLKQYAALLGISNDKAESCMTDTAAEEAMILNMRNSAAQYNVNSTPTFVILPSEEVISGAQSYGVFATKIEALLENAE